MKKILLGFVMLSLVAGISIYSGQFSEKESKTMFKFSRVSNMVFDSIIPPAHAVPSTMLAQGKFWFYMIAGWPADGGLYTTYRSDNDCVDTSIPFDDCNGPPRTGFSGMIDEFMGLAETVMRANAVTTCSALGDSSETYTGTATDDLGTFDISVKFSAGTTAVPSAQGYSTLAGSTFEKKAQIQLTEGSDVYKIQIEFFCDRDEGLMIGQFPEGGGNRVINFYFDVEDNTAIKADIYMSNANDGERFAMQFRANSGVFNYYVVRAAGTVADNYDCMRFTGHGTVGGELSVLGSNKSSLANFAAVTGEAVCISQAVTHSLADSRSVYCDSTIGDDCADLALTDAVPTTKPIPYSGGAATDWSPAWAADTTNGISANLTDIAWSL